MSSDQQLLEQNGELKVQLKSLASLYCNHCVLCRILEQATPYALQNNVREFDATLMAAKKRLQIMEKVFKRDIFTRYEQYSIFSDILKDVDVYVSGMSLSLSSVQPSDSGQLATNTRCLTETATRDQEELDAGQKPRVLDQIQQPLSQEKNKLDLARDRFETNDRLDAEEASTGKSSNSQKPSDEESNNNNESLDPNVDKGTRADEQDSTVSSEQEQSELSQELIASEHKTFEQRGQELIASERQMLENAEAQLASNGSAGMDTKMYHLVAYRIECIINDPSRLSRDIRSILCSFLQAIEGNFVHEQLIKNIASNIEASALADINGQTSIGLLCLKLERATETTNRRQLPDSDAAVDRLLKLKKEFPLLLECKNDLKSALNLMRGDHGSNYSRHEGTNFIINICHITMCTDVMQQISMGVLFNLDKANYFQTQSVQLYQIMNPNQQFNSNISVLEMATVIDRAFNHAFCSKDDTLTNRTVCVFENITRIMKKHGNEIFAMCDKVGDLNIDGTSSANSENYFIGTGRQERRRRTAIVNVGTFLFLRNYLRFDQFVTSLLLLPQVVLDHRLNELFDSKPSMTSAKNGNAKTVTKEYTMIPSKRDIFLREISAGLRNPGKPVVVENAKQLEAYKRLIHN